MCLPHLQAIMWSNVGTNADGRKRCSLSSRGGICSPPPSLSSCLQGSNSSWNCKTTAGRRAVGTHCPPDQLGKMAEGEQGRHGAAPVSLPPTPAYKARGTQRSWLFRAGTMQRIKCLFLFCAL